MPPTSAELSFLLHPLVPDSIAHNTRVLSQIRSLTSLLLGIAAGILGLESLYGFGFYFVCQIVVSGLVWRVLVNGKEGNGGGFFVGSGEDEKTGNGRKGVWSEVLGFGQIMESVPGFILTWAGVGGVVR